MSWQFFTWIHASKRSTFLYIVHSVYTQAYCLDILPWTKSCSCTSYRVLGLRIFGSFIRVLKKIIVYNVIIKWLFVIVATYRQIHWIKLNKWPLGGKRGSLWFYLTGFDHDLMLLGSCIESRVDVTSASLLPSLPRARAQERAWPFPCWG